ncbi:sulfonate ABC transporter substrate-binding protein [Bacillus glycinifermentans]|nr:aliphatic sulfonate ABC transporter substrate-binding protein [Bacillus glycinifermentans]KMM53306.1 sulfonate ABC transporter substrate-binding protein [Bacillus glycinifermentans]MEC0493969.1 aliphatic sulfonate ABC transporter substrate-binding protein [Bacillus glycinifermentans]MEC0543208.1 aliphatic sulfonate ABC transporter substrate-binding protein [Bacillus glycinifermentans]
MKKWPLYVLGCLLLLAGCSASGANGSGKDLKVINIGVQQSLSPLLLAKEKGWFEKEFAKEGIKVKWTEFQSGPPQFEGIAADKLDFSQVGNSPVIAGQAAGIDFKEIGLSQDGLKANGILVKKESGITDIKDLKGKKVAVAKGSSGFDFLYKVIDKAGLKPSDVNIIQLQPDEAMPAFDSGAIDRYSPGFTLVRSEFAEQHPKEVVRFLKVYDKAVKWQKAHKKEAVEAYSKIKGIDKEVVENVLDNTEPLNEPITDRIIQTQQETADFQYELKAINKQIDVKEVVDNSFMKKALKGGDDE